jgi:hypothetical protein
MTARRLEEQCKITGRRICFLPLLPHSKTSFHYGKENIIIIWSNGHRGSGGIERVPRRTRPESRQASSASGLTSAQRPICPKNVRPSGSQNPIFVRHGIRHLLGLSWVLPKSVDVDFDMQCGYHAHWSRALGEPFCVADDGSTSSHSPRLVPNHSRGGSSTIVNPSSGSHRLSSSTIRG